MDAGNADRLPTPKAIVPGDRGNLMQHRSNILFIGPETEGQRISSHFISRPLAVDVTIVHDPAAVIEAMRDPARWDLVLCKLSAFESHDISSTLNGLAGELLASIVVLKPRSNAFSVAAAYRQGAEDVVVVSDYEHLEVIIDRELHAARNRVAVRALLNGRERERRKPQRIALPKIIEMAPTKHSEAESTSPSDIGDASLAAETAAAVQALHAEKPDGTPAFEQEPEQEIQALLRQGAVVLQFQPIVRLVEGEGQGAMFEVLVRLKDGNERILFPRDFFPCARRNGLLWELDRIVLQKAMHTLAELQSVENRQVQFFINLSEESLADPDNVQQIADIIKQAQVQTGSVVIELRRSALTEHLENLTRLHQLLAENGHGLLYEAFALTDCEQMKDSTPYIDFVKLNPPLIGGVVANPAKKAELLNFLNCAVQNGVRTIAHAVETADTLPVLYSLGIQFIQGYFVSMPYDDLIYPDIHEVDIGEANSYWTNG